MNITLNLLGNLHNKKNIKSHMPSTLYIKKPIVVKRKKERKETAKDI